MALPSKLLQVLTDFGLSDKEAKVYLAMLTLGESSVQKIAKAAEVKRPTVYPILESLQQKGLVNTVVRGFKQAYAAESPDKLEGLLDQRRKSLQSALPEFQALYNTEGSEGLIKEYKGLEATKWVYEQNLKDIRPGEKYLVIANMEDWLRLDKEYFEDFTRRRGRLNIDIRLLLIDSPAARDHKRREKQLNEQIRFLPKGTVITTNVVITPQRLFFPQLTPPISGIVIENKSAIKTHMELFEILWNSAGVLKSADFGEPI